jgi:hypothetical protein
MLKGVTRLICQYGHSGEQDAIDIAKINSPYNDAIDIAKINSPYNMPLKCVLKLNMQS